MRDLVFKGTSTMQNTDKICDVNLDLKVKGPHPLTWITSGDQNEGELLTVKPTKQFFEMDLDPEDLPPPICMTKEKTKKIFEVNLEPGCILLARRATPRDQNRVELLTEKPTKQFSEIVLDPEAFPAPTCVTTEETMLFFEVDFDLEGIFLAVWAMPGAQNRVELLTEKLTKQLSEMDLDQEDPPPPNCATTEENKQFFEVDLDLENLSLVMWPTPGGQNGETPAKLFLEVDLDLADLLPPTCVTTEKTKQFLEMDHDLGDPLLVMWMTPVDQNGHELLIEELAQLFSEMEMNPTDCPPPATGAEPLGTKLVLDY